MLLLSYWPQKFKQSVDSHPISIGAQTVFIFINKIPIYKFILGSVFLYQLQLISIQKRYKKACLNQIVKMKTKKQKKRKQNSSSRQKSRSQSSQSSNQRRKQRSRNKYSEADQKKSKSKHKHSKKDSQFKRQTNGEHKKDKKKRQKNKKKQRYSYSQSQSQNQNGKHQSRQNKRQKNYNLQKSKQKIQRNSQQKLKKQIQAKQQKRGWSSSSQEREQQTHKDNKLQKGGIKQQIKQINKQQKPTKQLPNFQPSGILLEFYNARQGVSLKFNEPPQAHKPINQWRIYPFKDDTSLNPIILSESCYLVGKDERVCDILCENSSISRQHAVIQFRSQYIMQIDGSYTMQVKPYILDLESTNGTILNEEKIQPSRYYQLLNKDVIKFGLSNREYIMYKVPQKDHQHNQNQAIEQE